jgi:hypothetical protein
MRSIVMQVMKSAKVTRRSTSSFRPGVSSAIYGVWGAYLLWTYFTRDRTYAGIFGLLFLAFGLFAFTKWILDRRDRWVIQWDQNTWRITNLANAEDARAPINIRRIEQDGLGYYLYDKDKILFRLYRWRCDAELEALLDNEEKKHNKPDMATPSKPYD